jgi:hypothetical protein
MSTYSLDMWNRVIFSLGLEPHTCPGAVPGEIFLRELRALAQSVAKGINRTLLAIPLKRNAHQMRL